MVKRKVLRVEKRGKGYVGENKEWVKGGTKGGIFKGGEKGQGVKASKRWIRVGKGSRV